MLDLTYPPIILTAKTAFRVLGQRFVMTGTENVPRKGGVMLAVNHIGYVDFIYGGLAANPSGRKVRFMAKREIFDNAVGGPVMRSMHHIEVDRGDGRGVVRAGGGVPPRRRGRRHLPGGHDLPGVRAQGVQDRRGPDRRRGRRPAGAGRPVGHPADDDQGPPQGLLPRQDDRDQRRRAAAPDRRGPGRGDRGAAQGDVGDCSTRPSGPTRPTSSRPGRGGCRPSTAAPRRPSRRRPGWTPRRSASAPSARAASAKSTGGQVPLSTKR